jgi:peptidoglycan/xylan/chitin deacetylase (PgdA/CDA1 family)
MNYEKKYIMLHYLHNRKFSKITGSISEKKFENIVKKNLKKNFIYTFDDGLKSQYFIAKPILEKYKQKGIFFINTFHLKNKYNYNEISKFFIKLYYKNIKNYFKDFQKLLKNSFKFKINQINKIKIKFPYYKLEEIKLRILRSENLKLYNKILIRIMKNKKFNYKKKHKSIYMGKKEILDLSKNHIVGLHTHNHLFNFDMLSKKKQYNEIYTNKKILEKIIKKKIIHFSYPVGKYNNDTLNILKKFKIIYAFKNNSVKSSIPLTIPRININKI